jgi:hypothetical protein
MSWLTPTRGSAAVLAVGLSIAALLPSLGSQAFASTRPATDAVASSASVHYQVTFVGPNAEISSVTVSGLNVGSGSRVTVRFWGNPAGDPTVPATSDSLLSAADSSRNPCTQAPLAHPIKVSNGTITLPLCPSGGPAGYVSVHDLVGLSLVVNGTTVPVQNGGSGANGNPAPTGAGGLAFTGLNVALLALCGLLAIGLGLLLLLLRRRPER